MRGKLGSGVGWACSCMYLGNLRSPVTMKKRDMTRKKYRPPVSPFNFAVTKPAIFKKVNFLSYLYIPYGNLNYKAENFAMVLSSLKIHILSECYQRNRKFYRLPKKRSTRFSNSFVPNRINILNSKGGKLE